MFLGAAPDKHHYQQPTYAHTRKVGVMLQSVRRRKDEGFTLIELLIVIIILGILAAIVVFAVGNTKKDAVNASCQTNVKAVQLAEEAYTVHNNQGYGAQADIIGVNGNLKSWPTSDNFTLALTSGSKTTYSLVVSGSGVDGGTITQDSDDAAVAAACKGK